MSTDVDAYRFALPTRTQKERDFLATLDAYATASQTTNVERFANFPLWCPRQGIARFLAQWEVYKLIIDIHGSIIEGGVAFGGGLMAWAHFASIVEPYNHTRRVVGFDTFEGFPGMAAQDERSTSGLNYAGGMAVPLEREIREVCALHDDNRPLGHIPRVEVVKGNACATMPQYVKDNPHLLVALLVLDFDIYEPTRVALETFRPLMGSGSVIVWDEAGVKDWPGETQALLEYFPASRRAALKRFAFASTLSYMVL